MIIKFRGIDRAGVLRSGCAEVASVPDWIEQRCRLWRALEVRTGGRLVAGMANPVTWCWTRPDGWGAV